MFRVGPVALARRTILRPYYMRAHVAEIIETIDVIAQGAETLQARLANPAWPRGAGGGNSTRMMIVLEAIFEAARRAICPDLPTRLDCVFAWPALTLAERFRDQYVPGGVINACRIAEGRAVARDGGLLPPGIDLGAASVTEFAARLSAARTRADDYWRARTPPDFPELMICGTVEVLSTVAV